MRNAAKIAGALLALALLLAILGLVLKAVRWLLIIAAVVLIVAAAVGAAARRTRGGERT